MFGVLLDVPNFAGFQYLTEIGETKIILGSFFVFFAKI